MLSTSNTATTPKYVGIPSRKALRSNRPMSTVVPRATRATSANARWNELDHGTEIANSTAPRPRKSAAPNEPGAKGDHAYPPAKAAPARGRAPGGEEERGADRARGEGGPRVPAEEGRAEKRAPPVEERSQTAAGRRSLCAVAYRCRLSVRPRP